MRRDEANLMRAHICLIDYALIIGMTTRFFMFQISQDIHVCDVRIGHRLCRCLIRSKNHTSQQQHVELILRRALARGCKNPSDATLLCFMWPVSTAVRRAAPAARLLSPSRLPLHLDINPSFCPLLV